MLPHDDYPIDNSSFNPPISPSHIREDGRIEDKITGWTFELVQERLVEAMLLWKRSPGGGAWPFASDGPWHLIRKEWSDWDAREPKPLRSLPLTRDEMRRRDQASQWMAMVGERDRQLVVLAVTWKARGWSQVPWRRMLRPLGLSFGSDGLRMRYGRAIRAIAVELERRKVAVD